MLPYVLASNPLLAITILIAIVIAFMAVGLDKSVPGPKKHYTLKEKSMLLLSLVMMGISIFIFIYAAKNFL